MDQLTKVHMANQINLSTTTAEVWEDFEVSRKNASDGDVQDVLHRDESGTAYKGS